MDIYTLKIDGQYREIETLDFTGLVDEAKALAREFKGSTVEIFIDGQCIFRYWYLTP